MTLLNFFTLNILVFVYGEPDFAQVIEIDKQLNRFIAERKIDAAAELYSDDFVLTTSSGTTKRKKDIVEEIGLPELLFEINETRNVQVRLVGNTAVLTGILHQKGTYKEKSFDNELLVTDTWVLVDGRWKLLAGHATLIKK
jgi:ketosteroid isomerase-like protein